jgi:hypothetical protein
MGWDAGSVQLQLGAGGRWTAACGAAARSEEEDDPGWPSWAERPDNSGRQGKIPRKRKKINGP